MFILLKAFKLAHKLLYLIFRCFEFEAVVPFDTTVRVAVMDWDMLSGDDLIGETFIDIENRFYSKHRPSCGIQKNYAT